MANVHTTQPWLGDSSELLSNFWGCDSSELFNNLNGRSFYFAFHSGSAFRRKTKREYKFNWAFVNNENY